jgi:hypothetical protein
MRRSMDGGPAVRLGDDKKLAPADEILHVGRQGRQIAQSVEDSVIRIGEDAERRSGSAAPLKSYSR